MKKLLALILAITLVFSLAACGGNETPETTTVPEVEADATTGETVDETTAAEADTTAVDSSTATDETTAPEATTEGDTTVASADMTKAEFAAFLNTETAKIAKSGSYDLVRKCSYTRAVDIGGATDPINAIIKAIDENSSIDSVIGIFLGMGTTQGKIPKDDIKGDYRIKATSVRESDLGSFTASNGVYTFTLAKASDPKKTNATPFARFTNDFVTQEEVEASIAEYTSAIKVKETAVNYWNIKVTVTVKDGKITELKYSYDFDAMLAVSVAFITVPGDGAAVNNTTYSNIKY